MSNYTAVAEDVPSGAISAGRTLLQITNPVANPASHRIAVYGLYVSFRGTNSAAEPVRIMLARQTGAGTTPAGAVPVVRLDTTSPASAMTAAKGPFGAEPTLGEVLLSRRLHPQTSGGEYIPLGDEVLLSPGGWLAVVAAAAVSVDITPQVWWREGH